MRDRIDLVIPAYNAAAHLGATIAEIARQEIPQPYDLKVIVADDGSTDTTPALLARLAQEHDFLQPVTAKANGGRGAACNLAAAAGSGTIIVICDADCRYLRRDAIRQFQAAIDAGADAVLGIVELAGDGFWARYTRRVAAGRVAARDAVGLSAFTTANFAIRREVFERLGGFCADYSRYGFEDKDFLLRLADTTDRVATRPDIRASHEDEFDVDGLCRKAQASGQWSARIFRDRFPNEYGRLPYARCDRNTSLLARGLAPVSGSMSRALRWIARRLVASSRAGFGVQVLAVRLAFCAAFLHGTRLAAKPRT